MTSLTTAADFEGLAGRVKRKEVGTTPLWQQVITIYGVQGSGKTGLAAELAEAYNGLYLNLENSLGDGHSANELDIKTWSEFQAFVKFVAKGGDLGDAKVLVIDTVAELWHLAVTHHWATRGITKWPEDDFGRLRDVIREDMRVTLDLLRAQAKAGRLGLVFVAHEREQTRTDMLRGELTTILPDVGDYAKAQPSKGLDHYIAAKPHMVLRTLVAFAHPTNPAVLWPEGKYLTQANPVSEGTVVKDRSQRLPTFFGTSYEVLEREYKLGPEGRAKKAKAAEAADTKTKD